MEKSETSNGWEDEPVSNSKSTKTVLTWYSDGQRWFQGVPWFCSVPEFLRLSGNPESTDSVIDTLVIDNCVPIMQTVGFTNQLNSIFF